MSLTTWEVNGVSLEFNLSEEETAKRYENAFAIMDKTGKSTPKDGKWSEMIAAYCNTIRDLFNNLFGEESTEKIFRGVPVSITHYDEIYTSFCDFAKNQITGVTDLLSKYIPNRQQRRTAARQKKK